jgi:GrpB-like predicted nucleotidyltransferase (UPF0157 family)
MTDRYSQGIVVVAPAPEWAEQYRAVARDLAVTLSGVFVEAIEHVGSTSVPGLPAKPILDIDIIVQRNRMPTASKRSSRPGTCTSETWA